MKPVKDIAISVQTAIRRNLLIPLVVLLSCIGLIAFAWLGSSRPIQSRWLGESLKTFTPTATSTPGWWSSIHVPGLKFTSTPVHKKP